MLTEMRRASSLVNSFAAESPPRLALIIDVCDLLTVSIAHDETIWCRFG
jgi:hypothetical protein